MSMDPDRIRAYLQAACAGLGFEVGEVWRTSNESKFSTDANALEKRRGNGNGASIWNHNNGGEHGSNKNNTTAKRFVQLYTSKSFESRRSELVNPPEDANEDVDDVYTTGTAITTTRRPNDSNNQKHVLSPRLVDSIAETAQVVWATSRKHEGLTGRSDIALHTAVGMPVAFDSEGNMCVVVMFSPKTIHSTEDALDYLQAICRIATTPIPCLLPAFDHENSDIQRFDNTKIVHRFLDRKTFGDGVDARFVSIDKRPSNLLITNCANNTLSEAPKDCFGIPMLPTSAELGSRSNDEEAGGASALSDAFDEASYGIWTTVMATEGPSAFPLPSEMDNPAAFDLTGGALVNPLDHIPLFNKPTMNEQRRERLEEFSCAFLGMSVFDMADVWIPAGPDYPDSLCHVTTLRNTNSNHGLNEFSSVSENTLIKFWSGAVGRAYSSGNPVWSANPEVFVDTCRASVYRQAKILTAFAIPIYSGNQPPPVCVLCFYSLVRSGCANFVLRFVQKALRLLWPGLDKVEPHKSVGVEDFWGDVGAADLGEMAADIEMQQHFVSKSSKKRPRDSLNQEEHRSPAIANIVQVKTEPLQTTNMFQPHTVPWEDSRKIEGTQRDCELPRRVIHTVHQQPLHPGQGLIPERIQSIGNPLSSPVPVSREYKVTNSNGTKRTHLVSTSQQQTLVHLSNHTKVTPLAMPNPLPNAVIRIVQQSSCGSKLTQKLMGGEAFPQHSMAPQRTHNPILIRENIQYKNSGGTSAIPAIPTMPTRISVPTPVLHPSPLHARSMPANVVVAHSAQRKPVNQYCASGNQYSARPTTERQFASTSSPTKEGIFSTPLNCKPCRIQGCNETSVVRRPYCVRHSGNRLCENSGCTKCAQGSTRFCIAHGGGRRCTHPGCDKGARDKFFCAAHGGGKRCSFDGCKKSAVGGSNLCTAHGGGRRCAIDGCDKSAQSSTKFCVKHGGGKKCAQDECDKVARGRTFFCAAHGGGVRCKLEGCNRVAIGKLQLCRAHGGGAWMRPKHSSAPAPARTAEPKPTPHNQLPSRQIAIPSLQLPVPVPVPGGSTFAHFTRNI